MKSWIAVSLLLSITLIFPGLIFAKAVKADISEDIKLDASLSSSSPSASQSAETQLKANCDAHAHWKNHGEYVSCVARLNPNDDLTVATAAQSDIGKNQSELGATASASISAQLTQNNNLLQKIVDLLQAILFRLQHLFR